MEQLEAEAVLLGWPFDNLADVDDDGADPVARLVCLGRLVQQQQTGLELAPELGPLFERGAYLEPVGHHHYGRVLQRRHQLFGNLLLLDAVRLSPVLIGHAFGGRAERVGSGQGGRRRLLERSHVLTVAGSH